MNFGGRQDQTVVTKVKRPDTHLLRGLCSQNMGMGPSVS